MSARTKADLPPPMSERECADWLRAQGELFGMTAQEGWKAVDNEIIARAKAARPAPKSFEVHHERVVGQRAYITALTVANIPMAQNDARVAVGLPEIDA